MYSGFPNWSKIVRPNDPVGVIALGFLKAGSENENTGGTRALLLSVMFVVF